MRRLYLPLFLFFTYMVLVVWAADYGADQSIDTLTDVSGAITRSSRIPVQDMADTDKTGSMDPADLFGLLQAGDIPDISATYQPLDSDLTSIAALTTAASGRAVLEIDTALPTGVPSISSGTWGVAATLTHELGGVEADVSAYTGLIGISAGSTAEVDTAAELETYAGLGAFANEILDDADAAAVLVTLGLTATAAEINTPLDGASVTLTEFQELETIGDTTISANQWAAVGGMPETLTAAELGYSDGVTSAIQTQMDTKYAAGDTIQTGSNTTLPGTCTTGELYVDTDADTDGTLYVCVATNTWKDVDDDGATSTDKISEGDSFVEVTDAGTGEVVIDVDDEDLEITDGGANQINIGSNTGVDTVDMNVDLEVNSVTTDATANPGVVLQDSDAPGTDKDVGWFTSEYTSGADGSENSDVCIGAIQDGTEDTAQWCFDESDDQWETGKAIKAVSIDAGYLYENVDAAGQTETISSTDCEKMFYIFDDDIITFSLPASPICGDGAGKEFCFIYRSTSGGADYIYLDPATGDDICLSGDVCLTAGYRVYNSSDARGDMICLRGRRSTDTYDYWYEFISVGTWTSAGS